METFTSPWPWSEGDLILNGEGMVDGYSVHDAHGEETGVAMPTDGLNNHTGRANGILVLASPELFWLVRRFVGGCSSMDKGKLGSQLLHAWADAQRLLEEMEATLGSCSPEVKPEGGAA